jgi:hypothetical protein
MKKYFHFVLALIICRPTIGQNVGIGTSNPNASSILDVNSSNKGILLPRVFLQNSVDNITVPNPAVNLIVFNTNPAIAGGIGLFYNNNTMASPNWAKVGDLKFPYSGATSTNNPAFYIMNYGANSSAVGIKGYSENGTGLQGVSNNGTGVYAQSTNGTALEVNGDIKIAGTGQEPKQGKVLTSDANGNATWQGAIAFSAYAFPGNALFYDVPANSYVRVAFGYEEYDLSNNYTLYNQAPASTFTAPVTGIYHLNTQLYASSIFDNLVVSFVLVRNGVSSTIAGHRFYGTGQDIQIITLSKDVKLEVNDQVFVQLHHTSNSTRYLYFEYNNTWFTGRLVTKL